MTKRAGSLPISALLLGAAILGGALLIKGSLDRTATELAELRSAVAALEGRQAAAPKVPTTTARSRRPDPNQRYAINIQGAPTRGPATAPVKLVEFSDFQ